MWPNNITLNSVCHLADTSICHRHMSQAEMIVDTINNLDEEVNGIRHNSAPLLTECERHSVSTNG